MNFDPSVGIEENNSSVSIGNVYPNPTKTDKNLPRMGERLRLKADYDVSKFSPEVRTILTALQKHGMFVADNGLEWSLSCTPDERIPVLHEELRKVKGSAFEVVARPEK
jgi:hypothetical protein